MSKDNEDARITINQIDPLDLKQAGEYILYRMDGMSKTDIAVKLGISRSTLYERIARWQESGIMEVLHEQYLKPILQDISEAHDDVAVAWPDIVTRVIEIARDGKSDRTALEAAAWLKNAIVDPIMSKQKDPDNAEMVYAGAETYALDPVNITPVKSRTALSKPSGSQV